MLVRTTIEYSDSLESRPQHHVLKPFSVNISFIGTLPLGLAPESIPLQISVSLPTEYADFTAPVIHAHPVDFTSEQDEPIPSEELSNDPLISIGVPFFPLPTTFDFTNPTCWADLAQSVQDWLVLTVNPSTEEWAWGKEIFWIAFIAAHPSFPAGAWPAWDSRIALEGLFIESWVAGNFKNQGKRPVGSGEISSGRPERVHVDSQKIVHRLWQKFQEVISSRFPREPLIVSG